MPLRTGEEKRRAARVKFRISDNLEVRYKFLSHLEEFQCPSISQLPQACRGQQETSTSFEELDGQRASARGHCVGSYTW